MSQQSMGCRLRYELVSVFFWIVAVVCLSVTLYTLDNPGTDDMPLACKEGLQAASSEWLRAWVVAALVMGVLQTIRLLAEIIIFNDPGWKQRCGSVFGTALKVAFVSFVTCTCGALFVATGSAQALYDLSNSTSISSSCDASAIADHWGTPKNCLVYATWFLIINLILEHVLILYRKTMDAKKETKHETTSKWNGWLATMLGFYAVIFVLGITLLLWAIGYVHVLKDQNVPPDASIWGTCLSYMWAGTAMFVLIVIFSHARPSKSHERRGGSVLSTSARTDLAPSSCGYQYTAVQLAPDGSSFSDATNARRSAAASATLLSLGHGR